MKLASYRAGSGIGIAVVGEQGWRALAPGDANFPGTLDQLLANDDLAAGGRAVAEHGRIVPDGSLALLPPVSPAKIFCIGLNYADHAAEANMQLPEHPTIFSRFASSLVAPGAPIRLPRVSSALDFEAELAVIIGRGGRHIPRERALDHVAGYSCFNDATIRDYQLRTTQWTLGKNFDGTGSLGPWMVTEGSLPPGARGLRIEARLNGETVQQSSTDQLIFDVATLIATISEGITLVPGDVIATGTPAGVGAVREPKLFMRDGDVIEVEIEGIGLLANPVCADV
jgi:2-keto-4-pentenoate hydratase/2-oxohepta-3-ene-1,7-dioic acid hydratase in catechol pathway